MSEAPALHEFTIARELARIVDEQVAEHGLGKVRTIRLRLGCLREIVVDSLRFYLENLLEGSAAAGAAIEAEIEPARCACRACGHQWEMLEINPFCPACESAEIDLKGGRELLLESLETEEP